MSEPIPIIRESGINQTGLKNQFSTAQSQVWVGSNTFIQNQAMGKKESNHG